MNINDTQYKDTERLRHIAFIMDGNGRWAKKRGMPREYGHKAGAKVFKKITEYCGSIGIEAVTLYAFSTENWKRPQKEIDAIMNLFSEYLADALQNMTERDIKIRFLGDMSSFDEQTLALIERIERDSSNNRLLMNIAFNYGGRAEIVRAVNRLIAVDSDISSGKRKITEEDISKNLYNADCPPPDMIVRTGAEMRLSNFLMWQSAYSELYFTDILWPDFSENDVDEAVRNFYARKRRFGGI